MQIEQKQAEEAVRTLLKWIGENPDREGLLGVPKRVVESLAKHFAGWQQDPVALLKTAICDAKPEYNKLGMITFPELQFNFYCEHSLTLTTGTARIAYLPQQHIVSIGAMARLVTLLSKQLQLQEQFTMQLGEAIDKALTPQGVAVAVIANHHCADGMPLKTYYYNGHFEQDYSLRQEFLA